MILYLNKIRYFKLISLVLLLFLWSCSSSKKDLNSERDFQVAFNEQFFNGAGKLEVPVKFGRVDILTDDYAIEVDRLSKFHEGIGQALHYATETGKKPGLAIFIVKPEKKHKKKLRYIFNLCSFLDIKIWYINKELEISSR